MVFYPEVQRFVEIVGKDESGNDRTGTMVFFEDVERFLESFIVSVEKEIRDARVNESISFNCYDISRSVFGTPDNYWLLSGFLSNFDGGSALGRIGFFEDDEEIQLILESIQSVLEELNNFDGDEFTLDIEMDFDWHYWNLSYGKTVVLG